MKKLCILFITLTTLCHAICAAQTLTNAVPAATETSHDQASNLPNEPSVEQLPTALAEAQTPLGSELTWSAKEQHRNGDLFTFTGDVTLKYEDYNLSADKIIYHHDSSLVEIEGNLHMTGGFEDIDLFASHGELNLKDHTGRFFDVNGTLGVRQKPREIVFTTPNPFYFSGRELLETGKSKYLIVDGSMTNCTLPTPDWVIAAHKIQLNGDKAAAYNLQFKLFGVPLFYFPALKHPTDTDARQSGFLVPNFSSSSTKGFTLGEQIYIVLGRSADLTLGAEYFSERGFSPNGDFRWRGSEMNHFNSRWSALLDRRSGSGAKSDGNQGGVDILAEGLRDYYNNARLVANVEYLSNYIYKLVFNNNYLTATDSEVRSHIAYTSQHNGYLISGVAERFQSFASVTPGDEMRMLRLPGIHLDMVDRALGASPFYGEIEASLDHLGRAEPGFHARNTARLDFHPVLTMPLHASDWAFVPSFGLRITGYTNSQTPSIPFTDSGTPTAQHDALLRKDYEAGIEIRPPAVERDFVLANGAKTLRHVIEPELYYHYVGGIGSQAQNVLLIDNTDTLTNTNEAGFRITQRFYVRHTGERPCEEVESTKCDTPRQWASWVIEQKFFFDDSFGNAIIAGRRNTFKTGLDFAAINFLNAPRSSSPISSHMRFEAINNLRIEWDFDYDAHMGKVLASNVYSGYSFGRTTIGMGHSLLNATEELSQAGQLIPLVQSQQLQPYLQIGKPTDIGFSVAANAGYDLTRGSLQYGGIQAVFNKGCCGLTVGYRRFSLGAVRDETQYLYGFTIAGFGNAGDVRRSNSLFRDPKAVPLY